MSIRDRGPSIQEVFLSDRPAGETAEPGRRPALQSMPRDWAANGWADGLFMPALLGIGLALLLGVGMRPEGGLLGVVTEADLLCRQAHQDDVSSVIEVLVVTVFRPVPRC
jgi:CBS domain-containing protein